MKKVVRGIYEWSKLILFALVIAFWLKNNVVASALVPTGSMEQTVMTGSRIVINRLAYMCDAPRRGDIVSFYYPDDGETLYLKRIMGLPGEVIEALTARSILTGGWYLILQRTDFMRISDRIKYRRTVIL